jgi:hypothetical protein
MASPIHCHSKGIWNATDFQIRRISTPNPRAAFAQRRRELGRSRRNATSMLRAKTRRLCIFTNLSSGLATDFGREFVVSVHTSR